MSSNKIIITSPSLDTSLNVSGISSVTRFIIDNNKVYQYHHFEAGKTDGQKRGIGWFANIIRSFFSWCGIMLFQKKAIVHFNFPLEKKAIIRDTPFIVATRLFGKKMIIHLHGGKYLMEEPSGLVSKLLNIALKHNEPKVVLSGVEKKVIEEKFKISNVFVLPNCVSLDESKMFEHLYDDGKPLNLLFMGRIVESKGMRYIYEACTLLQQRGVDFNFFLAGKGPDEKEYIDKFSVLLKGKFFFKGVIAGKEKIELIKQADIFLLPSTYGEGLPMALLETMSFGLVPVTTTDGSMGDLIKNKVTGCIVNKHSGEEIANTIQELNNNRTLLKSIGQNAKKHIATNYDPETYVRELNIIYSFAS